MTASPTILDRRRVYIIPNRHGLLFAGVLGVMLLGSLNYGLSMGFALTFLVGGMFLISILHTFRNLHGLVIRAGRVEPVFAGETARFHVVLENAGLLPRWALGVQHGAELPVFLDLAPGESGEAELLMHTVRRGRLPLGRVRIVTHHPLGLVRAWGYAHPEMTALIYPAPEREGPPPPGAPEGWGHLGRPGGGQEDFHGLRPYHPGDSLRHIHWRALARDDVPRTKEFMGQGDVTVWLEWRGIEGLSEEARLSRLCRWVLTAEADGVRYGLRLPGKAIVPGHGPAHRRECLEALARHGDV